MAVRIYALARELGIDSQQLFKLIGDLGMRHKSPLQSLTDADVDQLREFAAISQSATSMDTWLLGARKGNSYFLAYQAAHRKQAGKE